MGPQICLGLLMGLPAAGKTTLTERIVKEVNKDICTIQVCFDSLIPMQEQLMFTELEATDQQLCKKSRKSVYIKVHKLISAIKTKTYDPDLCVFLSQEHLIAYDAFMILIDDNFYYKSMRYSYYQLSSEYECAFCLLFLKIDLKTALRRNQSRNFNVPDIVIQKMHKKLEPPSTENNWERNHLMIEADNDSLNNISRVMLFLEASFNNIAQICSNNDHIKETGRIADRLSCSENVLYQIDAILRAIVAERIGIFKRNTNVSDMSQMLLRNKAADINECRKHLFRQIKSGSYPLPPWVFKDGQIEQDEVKSFLAGQFDAKLSD